MCRVCLVLDAFPFFASLIHYSLSYYRIFCFPMTMFPFPMLWPCALRKYVHHRLNGILSLTPTSLAFVELVVFNFCLVDIATSAPLPSVMTPHVYDCMSECTVNEASTLQYTFPVLAQPSDRGRKIMDRRCLITLVSFFRSSTSGDSTLVHRNATAVCRSGLACLERNSSCATLLSNWSLALVDSY